ncbi:MAG: NACHT domain-containing protein [Methylacidiphilales bacterium]|nr:NACHT domain-containing protein [Candidatus Methylacidiphilales bacterium]
MGFEVNIDVPLGLVERKEQQHWLKKQSSRNYEPPKEVIKKIYKNEEFLQQIIGKETSGKNKHIAIIGEPGAGKTTLLSKIADFIKSQTQDLAIYISLASLGNLTLQDYLLKKWLPEAMGLFNPEITDTSVYEGELIKCFRKSGVWLLLDAVDEMGENSPVSALTKLEKELKEDWLTEVRVVLTCRLNVWDININRPLTGFDTYKTQEFKPEEIDKFIADWFTHAEKTGLGEILQAKLKESRHERIYQLVQNPLRLSLLCQIFYRDENGELPETKAGLYQRYVRYFYEWKPKNIPVELTNSDDLKYELHQALGKLALAGIDSNYRFQLPRSLCHEHMDEKLFKLACDVGWLVLAGRTETDEDIFVFWHQNFQEYFAALAIPDWDYFLNHVPDNPDEGTYRIFESQWKEVCLMWFGREDIAKQYKNDFLQAILSFEDACGNGEFYRYKAFFFGIEAMLESKSYEMIEERLKEIIGSCLGKKIFESVEKITKIYKKKVISILLDELINYEKQNLENRRYSVYTRNP